MHVGVKASAMAIAAIATPLALYEWAKNDYEVMRTVAGLSLMAIGLLGLIVIGRWYDNQK
jgi:hypothetical protein